MIRNVWSVTLLFSVLSICTVAWAQGGNDWEREWTKAVQDLAKTDYVINAMKEFKPAFSMVREENGLDSVDDLKPAVVKYYTDEFAQEYAKRNGTDVADLASLYESLDDDSIAIQYYYIAANPNPLGSKDVLDQADDKSTWSKIHGKYHSQFRQYLQEKELYDIFLIDLDTADIIYSVFKELDLTTSVSDGPYAEVFNESFQAVKDTDDKDFAINFFSIYVPSYEDVAYFFMAPIYSGDEKIGVLMIQVPL